MAKKKTTNLPAVRNPYGFGISGISDPTGFAADIPTRGISSEEAGPYAHILDNPNLTTSQKRRAILREKGLISKQTKLTPAEKEARKEGRKAERARELEGLGLDPRSRRSVEERREVSKTRGLAKRNWSRDMASAIPQTAAYYGISSGRASKASDASTREIQEMMFEELKRKLGYS